MRKTMIVALTAMAASLASCGQSAGIDDSAPPEAVTYETTAGFGTLANEKDATTSSPTSDALLQDTVKQPAP